MRADLGWSYAGGAMNTSNAGLPAGRAGERAAADGALRAVGIAGRRCCGSVHGAERLLHGRHPLLAQRLLAGVASALVFIADGLLGDGRAGDGLLLGLY